MRFNLLIAIFFTTTGAYAQQGLRAKIRDIASHVQAKTGVAVMLLETGDTLSFQGQAHYPMQSVYKIPISMAVLHAADQGTYTLDQDIKITPEDIMPQGHSPIREAHPQGATMSLREISSLNIQESDGTACDVLLRLLGGPSKANQYVRALGIKDMNIATTEKEQQVADDQVQYRNWATPIAMTQFLKVLFEGKQLSAASQQVLMDDLINSGPGAKRLKGLLPAGTVVAHKTGTSATQHGITGATNDAGIITLPNGKHLAITVFVSDSPESQEVRERVIAEIGKAAYEAFSR